MNSPKQGGIVIVSASLSVLHVYHVQVASVCHNIMLCDCVNLAAFVVPYEKMSLKWKNICGFGGFWEELEPSSGPIELELTLILERQITSDKGHKFLFFWLCGLTAATVKYLNHCFN